MQEMTIDQFIEALEDLVELSCVFLTGAKAQHKRMKAQGILSELYEGCDDIVLRWYVMEELERLGIIFTTTLARKRRRKHHGGASCRRVAAQ